MLPGEVVWDRRGCGLPHRPARHASIRRTLIVNATDTAIAVVNSAATTIFGNSTLPCDRGSDPGAPAYALAPGTSDAA